MPDSEKGTQGCVKVSCLHLQDGIASRQECHQITLRSCDKCVIQTHGAGGYNRHGLVGKLPLESAGDRKLEKMTTSLGV